VIGVMVLATIASGAALYGHFLRTFSIFDRCLMSVAALFVLGFVINHNQITLFIFLALLAAGSLKPFVANLRERKVGGAA